MTRKHPHGARIIVDPNDENEYDICSCGHWRTSHLGSGGCNAGDRYSSCRCHHFVLMRRAASGGQDNG